MAWLLKAHPLIEKDIKKLSKTDKEHLSGLILRIKKKYRIDMHPKEVHCVCPFFKGRCRACRAPETLPLYSNLLI